MRLDKYLKISRLIKRRTVAKEIIEDGVIEVNGNVAKPSKEVKCNDIVKLQLGTHIIKIRILSLEDKTRNRLTGEMYEVIEDSVIHLD